MRKIEQKTVVFAGTFDPFTLGHYDIAARTIELFGSVIVAVGNNAEKKSMFSLEERLRIASDAVKGIDANVMAFEGMLTDYCRSVGATVIVRGIRTVSDLEYERTIGKIYKTLAPEIEVVYLINNQNYSHIHGFLVRDLIRHHADISGMVSEGTADTIVSMYRNKGKV